MMVMHHTRINIDMKDKHVRYNWEEIQTSLDSGLTWREVCIKHGCSMSAVLKAKRRGVIETRNKSSANKLSRILKPARYHSDETKKRISDIRKEFIKNNPDKVPYLLNHYSKGDSYPEKYFKNVFDVEKIPLKHHLQVSFYQLDFYNTDAMYCLEIDGEQHYCDQKIVESDKRRTIYLENLGWIVRRIRWSHFTKLSFEDRCRVISEMKTEISDRISNFGK